MNKTPAVRFIGFAEDWEQRKIGDITNILSASRVHKDEWKENGVPFFRSSDVVSAYKGNNNEKAYISNELYEELIKSSGRLEKNDILITGGGSIGIPYIEPNNEPLYSKDADLIWIKQSDFHDSKFLYTFFFSKGFRKHIRSISHIGTIAHYTIEQVKATPVDLPSILEQKVIGSFFNTIDKLIILHQSKYEKLLNTKKSMLYKMFPQNGSKVPEIRFTGFTGDWEQRKFSDLVLIERGGSPRPIDDYITDAPGGLNWVKIGDAPEQGRYITKTAEKIKPEGLSKTRRVQPGDLILSNSMSFGKPYIMGINGCIHDGWLLIRDTQGKFDLKFLCHLLGTDQMLTQYRMFASGSTVNNLNKELVGNTTIFLPTTKEQKVIGDYLESLDNLITLYHRKLEKLKQLKQAMLHKMFL